MAMRSSVSTTVYLPPETMARVKILSAETKIPAGFLMRDAIIRAVDSWEEERRNGLAMTFASEEQNPTIAAKSQKR